MSRIEGLPIEDCLIAAKAEINHHRKSILAGGVMPVQSVQFASASGNRFQRRAYAKITRKQKSL
jgi:hypothetical protein